MNHPSEGVLQAFLDGELAADERARVAAHLEACVDCRAALEELRAAATLFATAVRHGDVAVAEGRLSATRAAIQRRAETRRARPALQILPPSGARAATVRRAFLRAAVLVLLVAGAASAAVPGSPIRRFFVGLWHETTRLLGLAPAAPSAPAPVRVAPAPAPAPTPPSGVSVLPAEGQVHIVVLDAARGLKVHVRVLDTDRASVEADGPAASAHFRTGPGRIEVSGGGAGDLRIGIPRSAAHATVEVDGKPIFALDAGHARRLAPADTVGGEDVFEARP